jgi:hypothetical protein
MLMSREVRDAYERGRLQRAEADRRRAEAPAPPPQPSVADQVRARVASIAYMIGLEGPQTIHESNEEFDPHYEATLKELRTSGFSVKEKNQRSGYSGRIIRSAVVSR